MTNPAAGNCHNCQKAYDEFKAAHDKAVGEREALKADLSKWQRIASERLGMIRDRDCKLQAALGRLDPVERGRQQFLEWFEASQKRVKELEAEVERREKAQIQVVSWYDGAMAKIRALESQSRRDREALEKIRSVDAPTFGQAFGRCVDIAREALSRPGDVQAAKQHATPCGDHKCPACYAVKAKERPGDGKPVYGGYCPLHVTGSGVCNCGQGAPSDR